MYALTAVLYHCLTGRPAYPAKPMRPSCTRMSYEPPPTVAADHPGDPMLNALTARGMAKEPGARFASASELMREATGLVTPGPPSVQTAGAARWPPGDDNSAARNGAAGSETEASCPRTSTRDGDKLHKRRPGTMIRERRPRTPRMRQTPRPSRACSARSPSDAWARGGHRAAWWRARWRPFSEVSGRPTHRLHRLSATSAPFTFTYRQAMAVR